MQPQDPNVWVDPLAGRYESYLAGLREKLTVVSKRGVGPAAKASRPYFVEEIERVETIVNAGRPEIDRALAARNTADAAVRAHCEQPVPEDEEGEVRYYVRRRRLERASADAHAAFENAVRVHRLPPVWWEGGESMAALQATGFVAQLVQSSRRSNSSTHASDVVRRAVQGVRRAEAMHYGYWEEKGSLDADAVFDDQTRRVFEYRWYWAAKELGLETGPEPDGLVRLPEYRT